MPGLQCRQYGLQTAVTSHCLLFIVVPLVAQCRTELLQGKSYVTVTGWQPCISPEVRLGSCAPIPIQSMRRLHSSNVDPW